MTPSKKEQIKECLVRLKLSGLSYVYNVDCPEFSEFGSIGFIQRFGGLVRTA